MADIESILNEARVFEPPSAFRERAHLKSLAEYRRLYDRSVSDPEGFWAEQAEALAWEKKWDRVLEWTPPYEVHRSLWRFQRGSGWTRIHPTGAKAP